MIAARLHAILDSDLWWSFTRSKVVVGAAIDPRLRIERVAAGR